MQPGRQYLVDAAVLQVGALAAGTAQCLVALAAEQHAVEAGQNAVDAVLVLVDELLHAVVPALQGDRKTTPSAPRSRAGRLGCGRTPR